MAESIITDSSNYSEDFEDSEDSSNSLQDYSESSVFPELFNYLEKSFSSSYINYRSVETPPELAVGFFLSQAKLSKNDFTSKLRWEYSQKKSLLLKQFKPSLTPSKFPKLIKSILCQMRTETGYVSLVNKKYAASALDEVRSQVFLNLGALVKDKCQTDTMLQSERLCISKKSEELEEEFTWTRFLELLKTLVPEKICVSTASDKQKAEIRAVIENYFKQGQSIRKAIILEEADFATALSNRRPLSSGGDKKAEISEICQEIGRAEETLTKFLMFSKRPAKAKSVKLGSEGSLLNRVINTLRGANEESVSQYLFVLDEGEKLVDFDFSSAEEEVDGSVGTFEIESHKIAGRKAAVWISGKEISLTAACVGDLYKISPVAQQINTWLHLYTIYVDGFYSTQSVKKTWIRSLRQSELEELFNVYLFQSSQKKIHPDCFPDPGRPEFKYKYLVVRESVSLNSGVFSKHWLIQLKSSEAKKVHTGIPKMCKWEACMSPLVGEGQLTKMATEFSLLTNKVKLISKKGLNPLKKSRTASEAIVIPELCIFHNNLRSIMRNDGLVTKRLIYDNSVELWKATQAGLTWQDHLSETNKLSQLCSGSAKNLIVSYFKELFACFALKQGLEELVDGGFSSHKNQLLTDIESLKKLKEVEESCTEDLAKIFSSGANSSYLKYALTSLQEAVTLQTSSKCLKIRSLKDQIESFLAIKLQNQTDSSLFQPYFRVSTAKQMELNSTNNESSRKVKEVLDKKNISPYCDPRLRVIKRFQKSRIPKTACEDRGNIKG